MLGWLATRSVSEQLISLSGKRLPSIMNLMRIRTWQLVSISENRNAMSLDTTSYDSMPDKTIAGDEGIGFFLYVLKVKLDADAQAKNLLRRVRQSAKD